MHVCNRPSIHSRLTCVPPQCTHREEVACDPWRAMRLYNEADKIEDLQEERKRDQLLSSAVANGAGDLSEMVDDQTDAVIVINDAGIVQMTNKRERGGG